MSSSSTVPSKHTTVIVIFEEDIWVEILKYLSMEDLLMMSTVSKKFYEYSSDDKLWKSKYFSIAPQAQNTVPTSSFKLLYKKALTDACYPSLQLNHMNWIEWKNPKEVLDPNTKQIQYDHLLKFLLVGDRCVGKSCILLRFAV